MFYLVLRSKIINQVLHMENTPSETGLTCAKLFFVATVQTIGSFNYSRDNGVKLKIFDQILWPWGTAHPTDQLTCVDDNYYCPEDETNGRSPPPPSPIQAHVVEGYRFFGGIPFSIPPCREY
jgi:hypothetical protein